MDLAADRSSEQSQVIKILDYSLRLINFGLVFYLIWKRLISPASIVMTEFLVIRNLLYTVYAIISGLFGVFVLSRYRDNPSLIKKPSPLSSILPMIVISIILTTFSYAIAELILDVINFLTQLVSRPQVTLPL